LNTAVRGRAGPAERHRAEGDEPALAAGHVAGQFGVAAVDYVPDQAAVVGGGAEQERRHGDGVMADANLVHLGQPHPGVVLRASQRQRDPVADAADPRVEPDDLVGRVGDARQGRRVPKRVIGGRPASMLTAVAAGRAG